MTKCASTLRCRRLSAAHSRSAHGFARWRAKWSRALDETGGSILGSPKAAGGGASHNAYGAPRRDCCDGWLRPAKLPAEPDLRYDDAGGLARADYRARADVRRPPSGAGKPRAASLPSADPCRGDLQRKGENLRQLFEQSWAGVPAAARGGRNPDRGQ